MLFAGKFQGSILVRSKIEKGWQWMSAGTKCKQKSPLTIGQNAKKVPISLHHVVRAPPPRSTPPTVHQLLRESIQRVRNHVQGSVFKNQSRAKGLWKPSQTLAFGVGAGVALHTGWSKMNRAECKVKANGATRLLEVKKGSDLETNNGEHFWEVLRFLREDVWYLLAAVASAMLAAFINVQIPLLLGDLVQVVSEFTVREHAGNYLDAVTRPALRLISAYGIQAVCTCGYIAILSSVGEQLATRLRTALFTSLLKQDIAFFDIHHTGELVNRLSADVQDFKSSFKLCISQGLRGTTQIAGSVVCMYGLSPKLTGVLVITLPIIVLAGAAIGAVLRKLARDAQEQTSRAMSVADEALANMRTVRAFAMEEQEAALFSQELDRASGLQSRLGFGIGLFQGLTNLALNGLVLSVVYYGGYLLASNEVQAGQLMSFLVASQNVQRSLAAISILFGQAVRGVSAAGRVMEYIKMEPSIPLTGGKCILYHSLYANVEFDGVTFSYPSRPQQTVLKDFSLSCPRGKVIAICGPSGAGKSTVTALMERFYDVTAGSIKVDGIEVTELDPSWLRGRTIGYINQEPTLFATSIRENIRYGDPQATDVEVEEAAKLANAHGFIQDFPSGYDTVLGERGATISGGQKQRIAIARALIKRPSILILDEATSALDAEAERLVQDTINAVSKGRTVLIIAHRLSTIQNADVIAVLSDGRIQEIGSHTELMKRKGMYADLVQRQASHDH
ncbi:ATP-binding cassette sub-family B member 8, mitochondrial isoform X2 [Strongylocentrotus purpuratus]|uniref:Mitochondrial potassium channel ATP-binding subunit n=1 Tax=Strongylocentrotus purpuratus TaxID=7668 RepID=A0A7M7PB38_STRPU|nr:ATP-binding cassette sub-family B member 8, mitochondrial isoform X2 [Strongylocentrotus purpuratus]